MLIFIEKKTSNYIFGCVRDCNSSNKKNSYEYVDIVAYAEFIQIRSSVAYLKNPVDKLVCFDILGGYTEIPRFDLLSSILIFVFLIVQI